MGYRPRINDRFPIGENLLPPIAPLRFGSLHIAGETANGGSIILDPLQIIGQTLPIRCRTGVVPEEEALTQVVQEGKYAIR